MNDRLGPSLTDGPYGMGSCALGAKWRTWVGERVWKSTRDNPLPIFVLLIGIGTQFIEGNYQ